MIRTYSFIFLLSVTIFSCTDLNEDTLIKLDKKSSVVIKNVGSTKPIQIYGVYKRFFPTNIESTDTILVDSSNSYSIEFAVQKPEKAYLNINNKDFIPLFLVPGESLTISFKNYSDKELLKRITFSGNLSNINNYYRKKELHFGKTLSQKKMEIQKPLYSLQQYKDSMLKCIDIEMDFFEMYEEKHLLPRWFQSYEKAEILYSQAALLDIISYRKNILNEKVDVPPDYYDFLKYLPIDNKTAIYSSNYYYFLSSLFYNNFTSPDVRGLPVNQRLMKMIPSRLVKVDSLLSKEVSDVYKLYATTNYAIKGTGNKELADTLINYLKSASYNTEYLKFIEQLYDEKLTLKKGDVAPYFYLLSDDGVYLDLKKFRGKIILLNFWFPSCLPCIKEIPYERDITNTLRNDDFVLLNICLFTSANKWKEAIIKNKMAGVHFIAENNWEKSLVNNYCINGYPHYTLIDREGYIIENICLRPSEGLLKVIHAELLK